VSTKIGIIAEGPIDHALLRALLERIARDRADYSWPVRSDDIAAVFQIRKRGHGGVLETVRRLVAAFSTDVYDHAFFVIMLDRRTRPVQEEIRTLIGAHGRFVLGVAIEEIESWWLADRRNTLEWAGLTGSLSPHCRYAAADYHAERDDEPKKTLDELTRESDRFDRYYGDGNVELAIEFAEGYWREFAHLDEIRAQCKKGYRPFERDVTQLFRQAAGESRRRP
jgi:hypothetical protein